MPRFYFNVHDGVSMPDDTGTELADRLEAQIEAVQFAGEVIRDNAQRIALGKNWYVEVTDDQHTVLFRLDLISQEGSAVLSRSGGEDGRPET